MQQAHRHCFVTNNGTLLAQGQTVENIAVGQLALVDAKTKKAVTAPTYATTKAFQLVWGTPDQGDQPLLSGVPNANIYSKLILGKNITGFRGKKAKRPQSQIITLGWSGDVADTNTLFSKPGESRKVYLTLTGSPIDKMFSKQGVTRIYDFTAKLTSDCEDACVNIDPRQIADSLVKQINGDTYINKFVKASKLQTCTPALPADTTQTIYKFKLTVCDNKDDVSLGVVQSQYPGSFVKRISVEGSSSVYEIEKTTNVVPTAFSNVGLTIIRDCATCPIGYTNVPNGFVYVVRRQDAGNGAALTTLNTDYAIAAIGESSTRLSYEFGQSTYIVISTVSIGSAVGTDSLIFQGTAQGTCVLTTPGTITWTANGTLTKYGKVFRITLGDSVCGTNRLTELQAFYPNLTVSIVNAGGTCVHTYETTVFSNAVEVGCSVEQIKFTKPQSFDGVEWTEVATAALPNGTTCLVGVKIEVAYINRITSEATFDYFPYDADTVHLKASSFDPNFNNASTREEWVVKQIRSVQFPAGFGAYVRGLEKDSKGYELLERSFDPVVRENEKYSFQAQPFQYYDEYQLDFVYKTKVGGWGQEESVNYTLVVFFPESNGKQFESALNTYLASAAVQIDPVIL